MKKLLLSIILVFLALTCVNAAAFEKQVKRNDMTVTLISDKPLSSGSNMLMLKVIQGKSPISDAKVALNIFMPAMPGMPRMESKVTAIPKGKGMYEAVINADMEGTWQVQIFVTTKSNQKYLLKTSLNL
ncbi:FixH family protein [Sulfuricurvum sp.]|uniref:FixH family protein n=1 Tax=Sulfuricurvum sp. TaxID=2025608 RepID=UPI003BB13A60